MLSAADVLGGNSRLGCWTVVTDPTAVSHKSVVGDGVNSCWLVPLQPPYVGTLLYSAVLQQ